MNGIRIISTGRFIPTKVMTNDDLSKIMDTNDEWIVTRTGIKERHYCNGEITHTQMCVNAAKKAIERAGISPEEIGVCVVATITSDGLTPSTACRLQNELGMMEDTACFDINAACAGFLYGMHVTENLLNVSDRPYGLVVGGEELSRITNFDDRSTAILFGDGAGAAVVKKSEDAPSVCAVLGSRGDDKTLFIEGTNKAEKSFIHMDGQHVFKFAVEVVPKCVKGILEKARLTTDDVDYFVFHQANERIIDFAAKKLRLPAEKVYKNIAHYGNTSAASIPIALDEMNESGMLKPGDKLVCVGFGGGLTWGGIIVEIGAGR